MKKLSYLIFVIVLFYILINFASAQTSDPSDVSQIIGGEFDISPEKIPTSEEDIEKIRDNYLKKEWTNIIANNSILGPIHSSLIKMNPLFLVIFKHQYEISLTFFSIFILWILFMIGSAMIAKSFGINSGLSAIIGIIFAVILAQIKLIETITTFVLNLIFKQENWWISFCFT